MDPLSIASLALTAAPGVFKGLTGLFQRDEKVQRTDSTPAAFTEALALRRQAAASGTMPGYGQRLNQLAQGQAASLQSARLGAGSGSDFLAAAQGADARAMQGQQQLGVQSQQYHDQATRSLEQGLQKQADYQTADTNRYNMATAALRGNGLSNIFGGLSDVASAGAYAMAQSKAGGAYGTPGIPTPGSFGGMDGTYTPRSASLDYLASPRVPRPTIATGGYHG